jgi:hypothetical protein
MRERGAVMLKKIQSTYLNILTTEAHLYLIMKKSLTNTREGYNIKLSVLIKNVDAMKNEGQASGRAQVIKYLPKQVRGDRV